MINLTHKRIFGIGLILVALLVIAGSGMIVSAQEEACTPLLIGNIYRVQNGDTLSGLGVSFGVTVDQLRAANCLQVNAMLQVGQELVIPPTPENPGANLLAYYTYRYTYRYCQEAENDTVICQWMQRYGQMDAEEAIINAPGLQTRDQLRDQTCTTVDCVPEQSRDQDRDQTHDCTNDDCVPAGDANQNRNTGGKHD
ncbi:MAG: LysM peptidoglycan-binding domain-containing protein [Anaerolineaceae bacterium]|nr:LysM peptidoglycan-binding domain-containing protein [Anaerolineaceae bacterium]